MINSIINAIATIIMSIMVIMVGKRLPKKVYRKNTGIIIVATIVFIVNFLICAVLGEHNNVLDYYYSYSQLSLVVAQLVYYNFNIVY